MLGAWNGHPPQTRTDELVKVPWLVVKGDDRRHVTAEESDGRSHVGDSETVAERLRDIGYTQ
jgi:hypothetical protein